MYQRIARYVGFFILPYSPNTKENMMALQETSIKGVAGPVKKINIDLVAVTIALTLAALIRLNVLPHISF